MKDGVRCLRKADDPKPSHCQFETIFPLLIHQCKYGNEKSAHVECLVASKGEASEGL